MGVLAAILAILFVTLIIIVPLIEKYGREYSPEKLEKIGRFILPLMALAIILQLFRFMF